MITDKKENKKPYDATINKEDKKALGDREGNLRNDGGADQQLKNRSKPVDFEGKDLDVPGRTLAKDRTPSNLKDEENQLFSQGGENHEDLEQDA